MSELKAGDVVSLKSGGPRMTISSKGTNGCYCKWFSGEEVKHDTFTPESLEKVEKGESPQATSKS